MDLGAYEAWGKQKSPEESLLNQIYKEFGWFEFATSFEGTSGPSPELKAAFHLKWVELGAFIRKSINDDKKLLLVLKILLPTYDGDGLVVYRGENLDRYYQGAIGFCWSLDKKKAEQFAKGLNACSLGGVLLEAWAPRSSILAGVHPHSIHLEEHEITINSSAIQNLQLLERFPPSH